MQKISPFLWFDKQAEEAANFYVSIFPNSKIKSVSHYPEGSPYPAGSVMTVDFVLDGEEFTALNGGPEFKPNPATSFVVRCETQEEVDRYWEKLTGNGGRESQCGWLEDKYGFSWQIVPNILLQLVSDKDKARASRAMGAMLKMKKIDIKAIKQAADAK